MPIDEPIDRSIDQASRNSSRRTVLKATLGAATVVAGSAALGGTALARSREGAHAGVAAYDWIIGCDDWGARPPSAPVSISGNVTNKIIVHHMAFPNVTDYSRAHALQLARDCQDLHMDTNGWIDTGQHFTVSRGGYVLEGRHRSVEMLEGGAHQVIAAHCPGENGNAIGIENEGTYITETPPAALLASLTRLCVTVCRQYGLHAYDMFGHWDFRETDCPGARFYSMFPALRRAVAKGLGTRVRDIPKRRWPDIWRFVGGPVVRVGQYLLNDHGYMLDPNGTFGDDTVAAVQDWQAGNGIDVDPDATFTGPTWESLVRPIALGSSGAQVTALQYILGHKLYDVSITGTFDHATQKAVRQVQALHGLEATGAVSLSTWCAVVGGIVRDAF